jgi:methyl-accepting chemotaxis protein
VKVVKFASDLSDRKEAAKVLVNEFENTIQALVQVVVSSSEEVQASARILDGTAKESSQQTQTVSTATEELAASVNEIASQVSNSANIVGQAVAESKTSQEHVQGLVEAANRIGEITELISDIADKTNLLALNATIEATRAGEAGKGFAVVASEVKSLAAATAKATEDITAQVRDIQNVSQATATAIQSITDTIDKVNEISASISGAVEEQSAATSEVASNIASVQTATEETGQSAARMSEIAKDLSDKSAELNEGVVSFADKVRKM